TNHPPLSELSLLSLHDALPIFQATQVLTQIQAQMIQVVQAQVAQATQATQVAQVIQLQVIQAQKIRKNQLEILNHLLVEVQQLRSEEHTSELQSRFDIVCRLLL